MDDQVRQTGQHAEDTDAGSSGAKEREVRSIKERLRLPLMIGVPLLAAGVGLYF